jgi:hypothetical protein
MVQHSSLGFLQTLARRRSGISVTVHLIPQLIKCAVTEMKDYSLASAASFQ